VPRVPVSLPMKYWSRKSLPRTTLFFLPRVRQALFECRGYSVGGQQITSRTSFPYLCSSSASLVLPTAAAFSPGAAFTVCACGLLSSKNDGLSEAVTA
jgi:hypothetical protein